ncbi:carboxypeptidase-like regulatory domain-containing protein [Mucilaginibacter sp. UYCu711]|uniref:carboxypeptidase-like regulatory domain-containing protein n=1 Tax=Mucilaginibacter sp. UYCu711 TaxID=3156339 RepID=UPI003D1B524E
MKNILALLVFILLQLNIYAQGTYSISGTVKNGNGELMESATVFLAGSEKVVATNAQGAFRFNGISPGTYQVVITMIGYTSAKQNIIVQNKSESLNLILGYKQIVLDEVVIGDKGAREKHFKRFVTYFMGETRNAKACKILNPDVIEFTTYKGVLQATSSDFLIIENPNLGYRVKYLLKKFSDNNATGVTLYDGDSVFEPLTGTEEQQKLWTKNRRAAYEGSLMHYLRSLYAGTSRKEGFLVYKITSPFLPLSIESIPIYAEQMIRRPDSNFFSFKVSARFYVLYDKKKAAKEDRSSVSTILMDYLDNTGSIFKLDTDTKVDKRGSYSDYKDKLIQNFWGRQRVGDQLPLEYVPD